MDDNIKAMIEEERGYSFILNNNGTPNAIETLKFLIVDKFNDVYNSGEHCGNQKLEIIAKMIEYLQTLINEENKRYE